MREKIEEILHQPVDITPYTGAAKLPLIFYGRYQFHNMELNGCQCILMEPQEDTTLTELRKQQRKMEHVTGQYCVLYLKNMKPYPREKMLEEGIPFIWEGHQIYLPFLGIVLRQNETREIKPCNKLSFLTQKMLLTAFYEQWSDVTVTKVADALKVSKMSITRSFDELEAMEIPCLQKKGKSRVLKMDGNKKEQWNKMHFYMRKPLIKTFCLEEGITHKLPHSGMTALSEYSMLADNSYKTYAVLKSQLKNLGVKEMKKIPVDEQPGCLVQELGYIINYQGKGVIDPLTVYLLMEEEREDPRVDQALDEMMETNVW